MYNIILVHIGSDFCDYLNDCILQIRKTNKCKIYLLISEKHNDRIVDKNVVIGNLEYINISDKHKKFNEVTKLDKNFRNGFWKSATERFFYIEDFVYEYSLTNIFHLENDNLIYFDINDKINIFENNYNIGAVFDNDIRCIPSFMYFKDINYISEMTEFILYKNTNNDMESIAMFKKYNINISNLPILPNFYDKEFKSLNGLFTDDKLQYSNNFNLFNSIFDGACIGQYIGGVDPRNQSGDTRGFINESCIFNVMNFNFVFENDNGIMSPFAIIDNNKIKINNLHIHSKNLKKYI